MLAMLTAEIQYVGFCKMSLGQLWPTRGDEPSQKISQMTESKKTSL